MKDSNLPSWLTKGAIAHHIPTKTCFIVEQLRRDRTTGRVILLDALSGISGDSYPLEECEAATLAHFNGCALLCVDDVAIAAASMASFFGGEVVSCS